MAAIQFLAEGTLSEDADLNDANPQVRRGWTAAPNDGMAFGPVTIDSDFDIPTLGITAVSDFCIGIRGQARIRFTKQDASTATITIACPSATSTAATNERVVVVPSMPTTVALFVTAADVVVSVRISPLNSGQPVTIRGFTAGT